MRRIHIVIIMAVIAVGCGERHNHATEENAHEHNETLQLVAYNADFEVYAEATPFVKGQMSDILAHFSYLENFKPITEGKITATLIVGTERVSQTLPQPTQTGIYLFQITPEAIGEGEITFDIESPFGKSQITIPDIVVYRGEHAAHEAAAQASITISNGVTFTKEQSWKVDFATAESLYEPFGQVIRTTAQILAAQGDERIVVAKAGGIVAYSHGHVIEGMAVSPGQELFTIDGSETADNNLAMRFTEAEGEYNMAKAEYERKSALAVDHIVSQSDLLQAKTVYDNAYANYNLLKRSFSSGRQSVTSPVGGFVKHVSVQNGQFVEAGQSVAVIAQNRNLLIKAEVQPKYFELLGTITSANIRQLHSNHTYTLEELGGRLLSYGKAVDIDNPLIPVLFQITAHQDIPLLAGSFVEIFINTQSTTQALTIPAEAIVEEMGNYFVFVQRSPELFEKRPVQTGVTNGVRIEVKEGVSLGERVVSRGAILVKLAQASGALDPHAGHVH